MNKRLILAFTCILLFGGILFIVFSGRKPFKNLEPSEVLSATVQLIPPEKTIQITKTEDLTKILNAVVLYKKDNSYTKYAGQAVTFALTMADGTQTEIMAYNPFLVIDGVGYRTKYEPCEALNNYANKLLHENDSLVILQNPPALSIVSDETNHETLLGAYSWQCQNIDGSSTNKDADSAHPLHCKDLLSPLETTTDRAILRFKEEPDEILSVCCWSDKDWSNTSAQSEQVAVNGNELTLKAGGYIYEVQAKWNTEKSGFGGTANYSFYIKVLD